MHFKIKINTSTLLHLLLVVLFSPVSSYVRATVNILLASVHTYIDLLIVQLSELGQQRRYILFPAQLTRSILHQILSYITTKQ